jgi:hypothetical protein
MVEEGRHDDGDEEERKEKKKTLHTSMPEVAPRSTRLKSRQNIISTRPSPAGFSVRLCPTALVHI